MSSIDAIREPITGSEDISDMCEPLHGLAQLYRAFNGRDLALMEQNWDEPGGIVMSNPIGGIKRGWNEIRAVYERIFRSGATVQVEFYDYTLHQFADIFYTVGRERGTSTQ